MRVLRLSALAAVILVASSAAAQTVAVSVALQRPDPGPAISGAQLDFTITASNEGPADAANVVVDSAVPSGSTFVSLTVPAGWICPTLPPVGGTGAIQCTTPLLVPGSAVLNLSVITPPSAPPGTVVTLDATISTTSNDPDSSDNTATLSVPLVWQTNLSVAKNAPSSAFSGTVITYTIPVTNPGPSFASDLALTDVLPPTLTFVSASGSGWSCGNSSGTVTCTIAQLAVTTSTITLQASTSPSFAGGSITNGVSLTATSDPSTRTASATTTVTPQADLAITKTSAPASPVAGQNLVYTVTVTNNGPSDASGVALTDVLPAQLQLVGANAPVGWSCTSGATLNCSATTLAAGASAQILVTMHVPPSLPAGTQISNTASVSSATADPTTPNSATASGTTTASADMAVTGLLPAPNPVVAGHALSYSVNIINNGPSNAATASMTLPLPAALTFASIAAPAGWSCTTPAVGAGGTVSCSTASFAVGVTAPFTIGTTVRATTPPGAVSATVTAASVTADPNAANNSATAPVTVISPASVAGTKSVSGPPFETAAIAYTIVLTDSGAAAQSDNPGDELVDVLPSSLTLISATATSGTALATTATNTVTWNGTIPAGGSVTITIAATVKSGTAGTAISNTGTIHFDADGNGTNESTATVGPVTFTPGPAANIPALSPLALLALALGLALIAFRRV